jgi:hypothetical protein
MVKSSRTPKRKSQQAANSLPHDSSGRLVAITPDTPYATCSERLTAFGGLLALVKFLDLVDAKALFAQHYTAPQRKTKLGHYGMVCGILMLLFIGWESVEACQDEGFTFTFGNQRAAVEPLIGEAQREGVLAIPSKKFAAHHAFFQIVMLAYNLWRWMKWLAGHAEEQARRGKAVEERAWIVMPSHTIRIARLKMLYVAAKIVWHGGRDEVRYSEHEQRAAGLMDFLEYLDERRRRREAA